jgi:soluble lytic murein transglycosylase-like protein
MEVLMTYTNIILAAAKAAKVSGALLLAICTQETNLTNVTVYRDGNSPSYGICQVKYETAKMLGFKGKANDLINPFVNAKWAAKYVRFQETRTDVNDGKGYGEDWCKIAAAYNAGTYNESKKVPGKPRNLKYVRLVQKRIDEELKERLSCNNEYEANRDFYVTRP